MVTFSLIDHGRVISELKRYVKVTKFDKYLTIQNCAVTVISFFRSMMESC